MISISLHFYAFAKIRKHKAATLADSKLHVEFRQIRGGGIVLSGMPSCCPSVR